MVTLIANGVNVGSLETNNNFELEFEHLRKDSVSSSSVNNFINNFLDLKRRFSELSSRLSEIKSSTETTWREEWHRYRQSRFSARRIRKRVIFKQGDCNITHANVAKRKRRYLADIYTTLVDAKWRWTFSVFVMSFLSSWTIFAICWYTICYLHGDFDIQNQSDPNWKSCLTNVKGFTSCFLFSVESQHTIGYGLRGMSENCPEAIILFCTQNIIGVFLQAFIVGIVFAKVSRPKKRNQTLLFSRNAVICLRDGVPCLMFRVGDMRKSHIIEAHVRAQFIHKRVTREGEKIPFYQEELKVGVDGGEDRIFFVWPTTIVHKIDNTSPIYHMSATDLLRERFEIVVLLEGIVESTGMTTQARSSYLPSEILWGHRFVPLMSFRKDTSQYELDYAKFNDTIEIDTPLCSAKLLEETKKSLQNGSHSFLSDGSPMHLEPDSSATMDFDSTESLSPYSRRQSKQDGSHVVFIKSEDPEITPNQPLNETDDEEKTKKKKMSNPTDYI